jgi:5-methyltetrahydropteroyltriglutamate--homocysteine methyltransferase
MKRSSRRILTTHVGSLARPRELLDVMREKEYGRPYDTATFDRLVREAVDHVVKKQVESGIDMVADGEMGKVTFLTYVKERLSGFEPDPEGVQLMPPSWQREIEMFPAYYRDYFGKYSETVAPFTRLMCTGPVSYVGQAAIKSDIDTLKAAMNGLRIEEAFMPATSAYGFGRNTYYATDDEYIEAVGAAMREEYLAIIDAGLILQIDDPWLTEALSDNPATTPEQRYATAIRHIELLNHCLRGIPPERLRLHVCYGLNHGPRLHDAPMREWVDLMLRVNVGAYSFEVANPRHQHEWRVWESVKLPEGKALIPGFISHANNFVEHPELIADGIETYARLVGRENVIAGADCGFSSRASYKPEVYPDVVWAKFKALAEGAQLATRRLWTA